MLGKIVIHQSPDDPGRFHVLLVLFHHGRAAHRSGILQLPETFAIFFKGGTQHEPNRPGKSLGLDLPLLSSCDCPT